jgi:DNA (cytosine-5)-methyltransferase 1
VEKVSKLRVFEAFSGIGTQHMALKKLGVDFEVVAISDIYDEAVKSYEAIHGKVRNLGDISNVKIEDVPDHDLFTYSFPCQDISLGGKLEGFSDESNTRSSLLWEAMRIAKAKKPKYMVAENVKNLLSSRFKDDFGKWILHLDMIGYNTYCGILNSLNYGVAQNRERAFVISIRKDIKKSFKMPDPIVLQKTLLDYLDDDVEDNLWVKDDLRDSLIYCKKVDSNIKIKNATMAGYLLGEHGDGIDFAYPNSKTRRGRVQPQRSHTLNTMGNIGVILNDGEFKFRRFSPLEYWRLMGISDEDFHKAKKAGVPNLHLYRQAGNAIVVDVLYYIFKELLEENGSH